MATEDFLDSGYLENAGRTNTEMKDALERLNAAGKSLLGATAPTTASISGDAITVTGPAMVIDTQGGASTDDLRTISTENVRSGYAVMLWAASSARVITLRHLPATLGGLSLAGETDYVLTPARPILLMLVGTAWKEVMSTAAPATSGSQGMQQVFTSNGTFTVPDGVTTVYVSAAGGGGGGAAGGEAGTLYGSPTSATSGGPTKFNGVTIAEGGFCGFRGYKTGREGVGGDFGGQSGSPGLTQAAGASNGGAGGASPFEGAKGQGGWGGTGGFDNTGTYVSGGGGGGGGSRIVLRKAVTVTPGASIPIVIGYGGSGGGPRQSTYGNGGAGSAGTAGILIVEW